MRRIVSDTGPLISLEKLTDGFRFIRTLYDQIIVPPAVLEEVAFHEDHPGAYLERHGIVDLVEVRAVPEKVKVPERDRLHAGEVQAIQLALTLDLPLLIEEAAGRRIARECGVAISGIAGQIAKSRRQNCLSMAEARAMLAEMVRHRRINERIYERLIAALDREQ